MCTHYTNVQSNVLNCKSNDYRKTEKQKNNIANLKADDLKEILDICIEELGVVDVQSAMKILAVNRSRIYQLMKDNNTLKIGKHKFIMINS